jgi:hypothetical protein
VAKTKPYFFSKTCCSRNTSLLPVFLPPRMHAW